MKHEIIAVNKTSNWAKKAFLLCLSSCILSCSTPSELAKSPQFIITVQIKSTDTELDLYKRYSGKILSFSTEDGFAIINTDKLPDPSDTSVESIENSIQIESTDAKLSVGKPNQFQLSNAEVQSTQEFGMGGWSLWSGGWSLWSGGWSLWSGGETLPGIPNENKQAFLLARIPQAQSIARNFGEGVVVAVIDTGLDIKHPGFEGRLVPSSKQRDFIDNDNDPSESSGGRGFGHGTAIAGLILQVAPKATIMPLRVLDSNGKGTIEDVVAAINFAVRNGADIINLSLGATRSSDALTRVIRFAKSKKVYIVASAGNDGKLDGTSFPARLMPTGAASDFLISVGSIDADESISKFSNSGTYNFMYAPGENLATFAPNRGTTIATGTSFATPLVTGALALAYGNISDPYWKNRMAQLLKDTNQNERMKWRLLNTDRNNPTKYTLDKSKTYPYGTGTLDVEQLIRQIPDYNSKLPSRLSIDLVKNGNFEGVMTEWTTFLAYRQGLFKGTNLGAVFSGSAGMLIHPSGFVKQTLTGLEPNTTYQVSAWAKVYTNGEVGIVGVRNHGDSPVEVRFGTVDFQEIKLTFKTGAQSTTAELYFEKRDGMDLTALDQVVVNKL
jgi:thermitase